MKKKLIATLIGCISLNAHSVSEYSDLPSNVLAEHTTFGGKVSPEYRGTFKFQLLKTGVMQKIDNHNKKTILDTLPQPLLGMLTAKIENIKSDELVMQEGPRCMDVPTQEVHVQKSDGTTMSIWKYVDCQTWDPTDTNASDVAQMVNNLKSRFQSYEINIFPY